MSRTFLFQSIQLSLTVLFPTVLFSINIVVCLPTLNVKNSFILKYSAEHKYIFNVKTVLFQAIQFSIRTR